MNAVPEELVAWTIGEESENPQLNLVSGWTYRIVNIASTTHPLELIEAGALPEADAILLSQAADGELEQDAAIDWRAQDDWFSFRVTPTLKKRLNGYRCAIHPDLMRGIVVVE